MAHELIEEGKKQEGWKGVNEEGGRVATAMSHMGMKM